MPSNVDKKQRSTRPVAPENSALADELRSQLKGKPTKCGFNRSLTHEIVSFVGDILKSAVRTGADIEQEITSTGHNLDKHREQSLSGFILQIWPV